jgi:curved DNA-binding protein CbpA
MTANLYDILGVKKTAKENAIKRAFRVKVRKAHPDCGGTQEEFEAVHLAYTVLMDPERRAKYDATGEIDTPKADRSMSRVLPLVNGALGGVMAQMMMSGKDPATSDVLGLIKNSLMEALSLPRGRLAKLAAGQRVLEKAVGKFRKLEIGGENLLDSMVRTQLAEVEATMKSVQDDIEIHEKALKLLDEYGFDFVKEPGMWSASVPYTAVKVRWAPGAAKLLNELRG